jgi:hypothetical protein
MVSSENKRRPGQPTAQRVSGFDLDKNAGRDHQAIEGLDRTSVRLGDVDDALMRPDFELLT